MTSLTQIPLTDLIQELSARLVRSAAPYVTSGSERTDLLKIAGKKVVLEVSSAFKVLPHEIMGRSRQRRATRARQVAMAGLWQMGFSTPEVGAFFSRDHATILHAIKKTRAVRPHASQPDHHP